jgi:hypothetical protein
MSAWEDLERKYRVAQPHTHLALVGSAILGSAPFGEMRNVLSSGADANGIVLHKGGSTLYIPWTHVRRGQPPSFPVAAYARETFLLGPSAVSLTIPQGYIRAPF